MKLVLMECLDKLYEMFVKPSSHDRFISLNVKQTKIIKPSETRICKWQSVNTVKMHYSIITNTIKELKDKGEMGHFCHWPLCSYEQGWVTTCLVFKDLFGLGLWHTWMGQQHQSKVFHQQGESVTAWVKPWVVIWGTKQNVPTQTFPSNHWSVGREWVWLER